MKNTIQITTAQLIEMLRTWAFGAQPSSLQYVTTPGLNADGIARFGKITKIANVGCMVGYKYANSVNNQREREGEIRDFMAQKLWKGAGSRVSTALATHNEKGTFYLTYKKQQTFKSFHFDSVLNAIPNAMLSPYYKSSGFPTNQGVDKPVYHREIAVENVRRLKFKKTTYEIVNPK